MRAVAMPLQPIVARGMLRPAPSPEGGLASAAALAKEHGIMIADWMNKYPLFALIARPGHFRRACQRNP
jgi:hypothetical protein